MLSNQNNNPLNQLVDPKLSILKKSNSWDDLAQFNQQRNISTTDINATFFKAVRGGDFHQVKKILDDNQALINTQEIGTKKTALHISIEELIGRNNSSGYKRATFLLLRAYNANVTIKDNLGRTPAQLLQYYPKNYLRRFVLTNLKKIPGASYHANQLKRILPYHTSKPSVSINIFSIKPANKISIEKTSNANSSNRCPQ